DPRDPGGAQGAQGLARDAARRGRRSATLAGADRTHRAAPRHPARRRHARRYRRRGVHRAASVRPGGLRQRHRDRRVELANASATAEWSWALGAVVCSVLTFAGASIALNGAVRIHLSFVKTYMT